MTGPTPSEPESHDGPEEQPSPSDAARDAQPSEQVPEPAVRPSPAGWFSSLGDDENGTRVAPPAAGTTARPPSTLDDEIDPLPEEWLRSAASSSPPSAAADVPDARSAAAEPGASPSSAQPGPLSGAPASRSSGPAAAATGADGSSVTAPDASSGGPGSPAAAGSATPVAPTPADASVDSATAGGSPDVAPVSSARLVEQAAPSTAGSSLAHSDAVDTTVPAAQSPALVEPPAVAPEAPAASGHTDLSAGGADAAPAAITGPVAVTAPAAVTDPSAVTASEPTAPDLSATPETVIAPDAALEPTQPEEDVEPRGRRGGRGVLAGLAALLVVLIAAVALFTVLIVRGDGGEAKARTQALAASKNASRLLFSYDYRHLAQDQKAAVAVTTGGFKADYQKTTAKIVNDIAVKYNAVVVAVPSSSSIVEQHGSTKVTALVFVNQQSTSTLMTGSKITTSRVKMDLTKVSGKWLVSGVTTL